MKSAANSVSKPATLKPPATDGLTGAMNTFIDSMHDHVDADNSRVEGIINGQRVYTD